MNSECLIIEASGPLHGELELAGAKNAALVSIACLVLASGRSTLSNIPVSDDVFQMIALLESLGARVDFDQESGKLSVDTSSIHQFRVSPEIMRKMRASVLIMGPLLARYGKAEIAMPGGCLLGARPIDYHLRAFCKMGATIENNGDVVTAHAQKLTAQRFVLEYPSVGATENILMAASLVFGRTEIVNAALEPEVLDLIEILKKMGASITVQAPATLVIEGVAELRPIEHAIIYDRLEAGTLLLAAAITGGSLSLPQAPANYMDVFLESLKDMGHDIIIGVGGKGIALRATTTPRTVSFKTMPYPGFPTDLQAPMMAAQAVAIGTSTIVETVFENRLLHVRELQKMGAQISVDGITAVITGVDSLYGTSVIATDIRAGGGLLIAALIAQGKTTLTGLHHLRRGYQAIEEKLRSMGAKITQK